MSSSSRVSLFDVAHNLSWPHSRVLSAGRETTLTGHTDLHTAVQAPVEARRNQLTSPVLGFVTGYDSSPADLETADIVRPARQPIETVVAFPRGLARNMANGGTRRSRSSHARARGSPLAMVDHAEGDWPVISSATAGAIAAAGRNSGERWSDGTLWDDGTGWIDGHLHLVDRRNQPVTIRHRRASQTQRNGLTNPL